MSRRTIRNSGGCDYLSPGDMIAEGGGGVMRCEPGRAADRHMTRRPLKSQRSQSSSPGSFLNNKAIRSQPNPQGLTVRSVPR